MNKKILAFLLLVSLVSIFNCSNSNDLIVLHKIIGPAKTNTYLLYDQKSKDAALIDVGGAIDTLELVIQENNLNLKYLLITHAHCDHVEGLPAIIDKYPQAKICLSKEEYEDFTLYSKWEELLAPQKVAEIKKYPAIEKMANFDYALIGEPHLLLEDEQTIKLGEFKIKTFLSPGHSRGSICYSVGNVLFSGDVLFYRRVGKTDFPESRGEKELIKSVRRLYKLLPNETIVYPGHGQFTDIGSEKRENSKITMEKIAL